MPQLPFNLSRGKGPKRIKPTPFYALNDSLPILVAMVCGFQHSLSMLAGIITPPIIFASELNFNGDLQNYMVAASLIVSGILSSLQMTRWKIPYLNKYYGTGLITVVGTSFTTLSTASQIFDAMYLDGTCTSTTTGGVTTRDPCPKAYGALLGTACLCSLTLMAMSFVNPYHLKRIFPPMVTGGVVLLIGASLIGSSGFLDWGGGSNGCQLRPTSGIFELCPTIFAPKPLLWGDARFIGLGFLSFITIVVVEFFGSPFMKNASIVLGLAVGMIGAGAGNYVDGSSITEAPAITFLWVHTFPLRLYGPAILPMMAVYVSLGIEAIGDITASSEASRQPVDGLIFDSRIQGGLLADGFNGLLSGLMTNTPMSIFAQNNGVIALTRCANRGAGYWCAGFLIFYGILAKISGVFLAIPNSVLGGVTTFLFATVLTSGLKVLTLVRWTRRDRFIVAAALSLGIGNLLVPNWASFIFTYNGSNHALRGFMNAIIILISTPFLIYAIIAVTLNLLLPADPDTFIMETAASQKMSSPTFTSDLENGKGQEKQGGVTTKVQ